MVVVDLDAGAGATLADELGKPLAFLAGDVSNPAVAERAVSLAVARFGRLDAVPHRAPT